MIAILAIIGGILVALSGLLALGLAKMASADMPSPLNVPYDFQDKR